MLNSKNCFEIYVPIGQFIHYTYNNTTSELLYVCKTKTTSVASSFEPVKFEYLIFVYFR